MEILHAKDYYLFPIYPLVFAAGAVAIERWSAKRFWLKAAVVAVVVLGTLPTVPLATWMLSPDQYVSYQAALGFKTSKTEVHMQSLWPQPAADQFGWPQLVDQVAEIYSAVPPDQRAKTGIWAGNYGGAGAVNFWGPRYGLPTAYSRHQNHWYWGPPPIKYENLILIEWGRDDVRDNCTSYQAFPHYEKWGMGWENTPIYLCRGVKFDIQKIWWHSHNWD